MVGPALALIDKRSVAGVVRPTGSRAAVGIDLARDAARETALVVRARAAATIARVSARRAKWRACTLTRRIADTGATVARRGTR